MMLFSNRSLRPFIVLVLGLSLSDGLVAGKLIDRSVVTVNGDVILESDIATFTEKLKSKNFRELFGGIDENIAKDRPAVLRLMIEEKIIDQEVKKLELTAPDVEVDRQLRVISERNGITPAQLKAQISRLGTTYEEYRKGIKRQLERRNLLDREIRPTLEVSDEQLKHYYQRKKGVGGQSGFQYHLAHVFVRGTSPASSKRVKEIHQRLSKGTESFEEAAKTLSDDTASASTGGDLGKFTTDSMLDAFKKVVPKISVGSFSEPIQTPQGFHLVKVVEARPLGFDDLSREEKIQLRNEMASEELERKLGVWIQRKKADSHIRMAGQKS